MSGGVQQSLFFLGLPDLKKLVCITLTLQEEDEEPRSKQIKTCRELVLLYSDILASPALDSFTDITVVMALPFLQRGVVQAFGQRRLLQLGSPQCVFPGVLQCCLSYSLITRLAPRWNKAGLYLVSGKDFLTDRGRLNAVSMELSTREGQLCISIQANTIRLPPPTLEDFGFPPLVLRRFCCDPDSVLDPPSTGGTIWCHVLPSMKKGQIITISRQLPRDGPFRTYRDLQNHWDRLVLSSEQVNLTTSSSMRPVLTQLPAPPPPQHMRPSSGSQPPVWTPLSQQNGANGCLSSLTQSQGCGGGGEWPSSSSSSLSCVSFSSSDSSGYQSAPSLSSSSSLPLLQPASSLTSSSSVLPPLPPPSQTLMNPAPKLVPIFKNKHPSRHVNVALLRVQKQREHLSGGGQERRRVTLPCFRKNRPATAPLPLSFSFASLPTPPPPTVPHFKRRPKPPSSTTHQPSPPPNVKHIPSLSPALKAKPGFNLASKPKSSPKTSVKFSSESSTAADSRPSAAVTESPPPPPPLTSSDISNKDSCSSSSSRRRVVFDLKPKKSRAVTQDVEVEKMARSNQLSRLNSATLLSWLRGRGVLISAKHKKEELMLKVMGCLAEA
ncbi:uncharacterized protein C18orf63 homolog isoform X4 [Trachinotus anak]|uniref:uncharacterized protein C18orf63 homolog isoform X4 n=1 Tax=Trachinotus anak TaxID=443729 RepID=UPI0039F1F930